jgi:hypothetical protein
MHRFFCLPTIGFHNISAVSLADLIGIPILHLNRDLYSIPLGNSKALITQHVNANSILLSVK